MKITYRLRPASKGKKTVLCRVTYKGQRAKVDFSTGVQVEEAEWDRRTYRSTTDRGANARLAGIEQDLLACYAELRRTRRKFTAEDIRQAYLKDNVAAIGLRECSLMVLAEVGASHAKPTLQKNTYFHNKLMAYFGEAAAQDITEQAAWDYFRHLRQKEGNSHEHASRACAYLKRCLETARKKNLLTANPLEGFSVPRKKKGTPNRLEPGELERFKSFGFADRTLEWARDLFIFMCMTGMDLADCFDLVPERDIKIVRGGTRLVDRLRLKNGMRYVVPLEEEAGRILHKWGTFKPCAHQYYNRVLKQACFVAGVDRPRISSRWARKTAANIWLNCFLLSAESVSLMLGHEGKATLHEYYAKVSQDRVIQEWSEKRA